MPPKQLNNYKKLSSARNKVKICFGSRKLLQQKPKINQDSIYETYADWRHEWDLRRNNSTTSIGEKTKPNGNPEIQWQPDNNILRIRLIREGGKFYLHISVARQDNSSFIPRERGALGVDFNVKGVAWAVVKPDGNLKSKQHGFIEWKIQKQKSGTVDWPSGHFRRKLQEKRYAMREAWR